MENLPKVDVGTKVRTVALFVALINQALTVFHKNPIPFDSDKVELVFTWVLTAVTAVWAWWKNNDFTKKARLVKEQAKQAQVQDQAKAVTAKVNPQPQDIANSQVIQPVATPVAEQATTPTVDGDKPQA